MLESHRDGSEKDISSLVKYAAMLKREYEKTKAEKKSLRSEFDRYKRDNLTKDVELKEYRSQAKHLASQLSRSEEDLKAAEREKELLKRRIQNLQKSIRSPHALGSVENLSKTPQIASVTTPDLFNDSAFGDKRVEVDSPCSPEILGSEIPKGAVNKRSHDQENEVRYLKISSASNQAQNPAKKVKRDTDDVGNFTGLGSFNIFKKKSGVGDYSSKIRTGYNGLGCVETFTQPSAKPKLLVSKKTASRTSLNNGKKVKVPTLPRLDGFINLD